MRFKIAALLCLLLMLSGCRKDAPGPAQPQPPRGMESLNIPPAFNWRTTRDVTVNVTVRDLDGSPAAGVRVLMDGRPIGGGVGAAAAEVLTSPQGAAAAQLALPMNMQNLHLFADVVGSLTQGVVPVTGAVVNVTLGGGLPFAQRSEVSPPRTATLRHFPEPKNTGSNMSVLIERLAGVPFASGAELACLTREGLVAGAEALEGAAPYGMAVWGDDHTTPEKDGFNGGETLRFVYWDPDFNREIDAAITNISGGGPVYFTNGFLIIDLYVEPPEGLRYMGSWDSLGVPGYLAVDNQRLDPRKLLQLGRLTPEGVSPEGRFPGWDAGADLQLIGDATVTVAFVHEGTDRRATAGFYTYPFGREVHSVEDIERATVVFPNASFVSSGGGLRPGHRVALGNFTSGTQLGFFVIPEGWQNGSVNAVAQTYYSSADLNPEPGFKQHALPLVDEDAGVVYVCFQLDDNSQPNEDKAFNDLILMVTVSPSGSLERGSLPPLSNPPDADDDGAPDNIDRWVNDPARAFVWHDPIGAERGVIALENGWPRTGDWDFNDLAIGCAYQRIVSAGGSVSALNGRFTIRAVGTQQHDGFGFMLPIGSDRVAAVTGHRLTAGIVNLSGNGCEAAQDRAVIVVFDDALALVQPPPGAPTVNTTPASTPVQHEPLSIEIRFTQPIPAPELGTPPFNPFAILAGRRGLEVHRPDDLPTALMAVENFGREKDRSSPETGRFYRGEGNRPWMLFLPADWKHPLEQIELPAAYAHFGAWAEAGGSGAAGWYLPLTGNYINDRVWR